MASQAEMDFAYSLTDRLFRLSVGELSDFSGAKFDGDFALSLEQAQRKKHEFVVESLKVPAGGRVADLGCGWGAMLNYLRTRGIHGVGVTLSRGQQAACQRHGLEVHLHDCPAVAKLRGDRGRWVDVEWEQGEERLFDVTIRVLTKNARGVLASIASAISEEDCNIRNINMDSEQGIYNAINLVLQVHDRVHLARVMRGVRRVPEVVRIGRLKADTRS